MPFNLAQPPVLLAKSSRHREVARETSRSGDAASQRRDGAARYATSVSLPPHSKVIIAPGEAGPLMH